MSDDDLELYGHDVDKPWAYVHYKLGGFQRKVPISFIKNIDLSNIKYECNYWAFRSNRKTESPETVLQRLVKIPKFERLEQDNFEDGVGHYGITESPQIVLQGLDKIPKVERLEEADSEDGAGYYRAIVTVVKDTLKDLKDHLSKNRPREKPDCLLSQSFESRPVPEYRPTTMSVISLTEGKETEAKSRLNTCTYSNVQAITDSVQHNPFNFSAEERESSRTKTKPAQSSATINDVQLNSRQNQVIDESGCVEKRKSLKRRPSTDVESSDESDHHFISPMKYQKILDKLRRSKEEISELRSLNERLQSRLKECQCGEGRYILPDDGHGETSHAQQHKGVASSIDTHAATQPKSIVAAIPLTSTVAAMQPKNTVTAIQLESSIPVTLLNIILSRDGKVIGSTNNRLNSVSDEISISDSTAPASDSVAASLAEDKLARRESCEIITEGGGAADKSEGMTPESTKNDGICVKALSVTDQEGSYEFYPGRVLSKQIMDDLWSNKLIEFGEKGDSMFVKIISVMAWGKNHLASHVVSGKKKKDGAPPDRHTLDSVRLKAVRDLLRFRIEREIGETIADYNHPRLKTPYINGYIRDKIKSLRSSGFGKRDTMSPRDPLCIEDLRAGTSSERNH